MNQIAESNNFVLLATTHLEFVAPWNNLEYKTKPTGQYRKVIGAAKTALFLKTYCVHLSLTEEQINMLEAYFKMNKYQENDNFTIDEKFRFPFFSLDKGEVVNGKKMVYTMELYSLEDYTNVVELAPAREEEQVMKLEDK
jgi:hypothetical protein